MRQPELHLFAVYLRAGLQLREADQRLRQPELHLRVLHLRAGLQLRVLIHGPGFLGVPGNPARIRRD